MPWSRACRQAKPWRAKRSRHAESGGQDGRSERPGDMAWAAPSSRETPASCRFSLGGPPPAGEKRRFLRRSLVAHKKTPPGTFCPGRSSLTEVGQRLNRSTLIDLKSLRGNRPADRDHAAGSLRRSRRIGRRGGGGSLHRGRSRTASRLAAAVAGRAVGLAAAAGAAAAMAALLRLVDGAEQTTDRATLLLAASVGTAARLAAASIGVAGRLAAAGAGSAGGLRTTVASTAGRLAAAVAGAAVGLTAAAGAAVVLPLALLEQALQPAEKVMLLATAASTGARTRIAARLAAAVAGTASGLRTTVASTAGRFRTSIAGAAGRLAGVRTAVAGSAIGLTARGAALVVSEHPVEELETKGLTTNGDAENQRTEEQHTLHRATSPLLVNHVRVFVPVLRFVTPRL